MKRGDIILTAPAGDYGKARPVVVVQSDALAQADSVLVSLMTGIILDAPIYRVTVEPTRNNGLQKTFQIMVEKILAVPRRKCSDPVGRLTTDQIAALDHKLSVVIGLAD